MEDREYFDVLYQGWSKTTGAADMFWMPEEDKDEYMQWRVMAVNQAEEKKWVASFHHEEDCAFIVAAHGSISDLIRRLHMALDEADRLDRVLDDEINRVGEQVMEIMELKEYISDLEGKLAKQSEPSFQRDYTAYHAADTVYPFGRQV